MKVRLKIISNSLDSIIDKRLLLCLCTTTFLTVTFGDMLKKTSCPRIPIKEVYAATNHLNEMNIIGEGTAGEILFLFVFFWSKPRHLWSEFEPRTTG